MATLSDAGLRRAKPQRVTWDPELHLPEIPGGGGGGGGDKASCEWLNRSANRVATGSYRPIAGLKGRDLPLRGRIARRITVF